MIATNAMDELPWSSDPGRFWDFTIESPPWGDSIQFDTDVTNFHQHEEAFPWESIGSKEVQTHQPVDSLTDLQRSKFPQDPMVPSTVNHHISSLSPAEGQAIDANPYNTLSNFQPQHFPQAHAGSSMGEFQVPSYLNLPKNQVTSADLPINHGKAKISSGSGNALASKKISGRRDYDSSAFGWLLPSSTQRKAVRPERRPMNMPSASPQGDSNVPKANDDHNKRLEPARQEQTLITDSFQAGLNAAAQEIFGKRGDAVAPNSRLPKFQTPETFSPSAPIKKPRIAKPAKQEMPFTDSFQAGLNAAMQEIFNKRIGTVVASSNDPKVYNPVTASLSHPVDGRMSSERVPLDKPSTTSFQEDLDQALQDIFSKRIDTVATNARLPKKVHLPDDFSTLHAVKKPRISEPATQEKPSTDFLQAGLNTAAQTTSSQRTETVATSTTLPDVYPPEAFDSSHPVDRPRIMWRASKEKPFTDSFQAGLDVAIRDMASKRMRNLPPREKLLNYYPSETSNPSYAVKKVVIMENDPKFYSRKVRFDRDLFIDENAIEEHKRNIDKIMRVLDWIPGKNFLVIQEGHFAKRLETYTSINQEIRSSETGQKRRRLDRGPRYTWVHSKRRQLIAHKDMWHKYWKAQTGIDFKKSFEDQIINRQLREAFPSFLFYIEIIMTVVRGKQEPVGSLQQKKEQLLQVPKINKLFKFDLDHPPTKPKEKYNNKQKKIKDFMDKMGVEESRITDENQQEFISKVEYTNGLITASEVYLEVIRYLESYVMKGKLGEDNPFKEETKVLKSAFDGSKLSYNFTIWVFLELWIKIYRPILWVQMLDSRGGRIVDTAKSLINDVFCYGIDKLNIRYEELMENEELISI